MILLLFGFAVVAVLAVWVLLILAPTIRHVSKLSRDSEQEANRG